jgi:hypothetical protein
MNGWNPRACTVSDCLLQDLACDLGLIELFLTDKIARYLRLE